MGRRERAIRNYCGELLGTCIDPGRVAPQFAVAIRETLPPFDDQDRAGVTKSRSELVHELILARCNAATEAGRDCESRTDELLDLLWGMDPNGSTPPEDYENKARE
jgi:hypothetical protein